MQNSNTTVSSYFNHPIDIKCHFDEMTPLILKDRYMGIEIELERNPEFEGETNYLVEYKDMKNLTVTSDGSLRNDGFELVLERPLYGSTLVDMVKTISKVDVRGKVLHNFRTSTHIHIDVRDLTSKELIKVIKVFSIIEPTIASLFPRRYESPYVVPLKNHIVSYIKEYSAILYQGYLSKVNSIGRYCSLNLVSLDKFGSLEFRMFPSTTNYNTLLFYINLVQWITSYFSKTRILYKSVLKDFEMVFGISAIDDKEYSYEIVNTLIKTIKPLHEFKMQNNTDNYMIASTYEEVDTLEDII